MQENTCEVFKISRATLNNWLQLRRETRIITLQPCPVEQAGKIKQSELTSYLEEIWTVLGVTGSAVYLLCLSAMRSSAKKPTTYPESDPHRRALDEDFLDKILSHF